METLDGRKDSVRRAIDREIDAFDALLTDRVGELEEQLSECG